MSDVHNKMVALLIAVMSLGACSKSSPSSSGKTPAPSLNSALSPSAVRKAAKQAKADSLPQPDPNTPDSAYVHVTKGNQVMFMYAAFSGLPVDYDTLMQSYSNAYRMTSDAFKKHDLLGALKPKVDAAIADAKAHPYITWTDDSPQIEHYDFSQKSFQVGSALFQQGGYLTFFDNPGYVLAVTNGDAFRQLHVADQGKARAIEAMVGKYPSMKLKVFAFVQSTDDSSTPTVQARITKVQLVDAHGQVLLQQKAPE